MSEFEEWWKDQKIGGNSKTAVRLRALTSSAFQAGQNSRQPEIDALKLQLSGRTQSFDPASVRHGMMLAAEIARRGASKTPEPNSQHSIRSRIANLIKAKAEEIQV